ncbi:VOC family protein [Streptomyces sp. NBC_01619]|uniref:VOC family protein n=1 Tax=Streptomyces sp. NBC_01619 TaxID=2975901 RepID=UPI00224F06AC|nr:VOC family protein [Streptomyces sp. NBC_01619]MCX4515761.1 VOC family protein [Streptomyces sp. NBC_01619]
MNPPEPDSPTWTPSTTSPPATESPSPQRSRLQVNDLQALSDYGRPFLERTADGPTFLNWAVLTDDIESTARRVERITGTNSELLRGESVSADGVRMPWAEAAFAVSWSSRVLPFFLSYGEPAACAQQVAGDVKAARHRIRPLSMWRLVTGTPQEPEWATRWPGLSELAVGIAPESGPVIDAVYIDTVDGETVVRLP